ncbi:MAG: hypothetical protein LBQ88_11405 [Treponema sp.]|jgi:hypothetical protein|nr:hypothetical protein [Treponema sp.]
MQIQKVDPNRESFSEYSLDGTILTIGDIELDLAEEQQDQEIVIPFGTCEGVIHRGLMPCCSYVAEVVIPPRRYEIVEVPDEPGIGTVSSGGTKKKDEEPGTHTENVPLPLDIDSVVLKLWPIVDMPEEKAMEGEENNAE